MEMEVEKDGIIPGNISHPERTLMIVSNRETYKPPKSDDEDVEVNPFPADAPDGPIHFPVCAGQSSKSGEQGKTQTAVQRQLPALQQNQSNGDTEPQKSSSTQETSETEYSRLHNKQEKARRNTIKNSFSKMSQKVAITGHKKEDTVIGSPIGACKRQSSLHEHFSSPSYPRSPDQKRNRREDTTPPCPSASVRTPKTRESQSRISKMCGSAIRSLKLEGDSEKIETEETVVVQHAENDQEEAVESKTPKRRKHLVNHDLGASKARERYHPQSTEEEKQEEEDIVLPVEADEKLGEKMESGEIERKSTMHIKKKNVKNSNCGRPSVNKEKKSGFVQCRQIFSSELQSSSEEGKGTHSSEVVQNMDNLNVEPGSAPTTKAIQQEMNDIADEMLTAVQDTKGYVMEPDLDRLTETDSIYFRVNTLNSKTPPLPFPRSTDVDMKFGDVGFVSFPWDENNVRNGVRHYLENRNLMELICEEAPEDISPFLDLIKINSDFEPEGLAHYYEMLSESSQAKIINILTRMTELALEGPDLFTKPLAKLSLENFGSKSATLSKKQCACILAHAFFCTFPTSNDFVMNDINMHSIHKNQRNALTKLPFLLSYFESVLNSMPPGCVSFRRVKRKSPDWKCSTKKLPKLGICMPASDRIIGIEECVGCLQMDFANKFIGGGVLDSGCVQEEIRFLCCPEMIVSLLLCPVMDDLEAIFINGAATYSHSSGYASTLRHVKLPMREKDPDDKFCRTQCEVVAIDALQFRRNSNLQFTKEAIDRELGKAFSGFSARRPSRGSIRPVATGNWGCGVFGGDLELKSLIQLIAAGEAGRSVIYIPFTERKFATSLYELYSFLQGMNYSVGSLYKLITEYQYRYSFSLFDFIKMRLSRSK